ncbi:MAG: tetratricopeptide repeat protein [Bdellovibrionales bacterium]|nr:tetratricopeptide repeat protein [Bdellovibrionales bacterium]
MTFPLAFRLPLLAAFFLGGCATQTKTSVPTQEELFTDTGIKKTAEIQETMFVWVPDSKWPVSGSCSGKPSAGERATSRDWLQVANSCAAKKQWNELQKVATDLLERFPESAWGNYYLSLVFEHQGFLDRALWTIDLAQRKGAQWGVLSYQKARIHWAKGDYQEAEAAFLKALEKDQGLNEAHYFLGRLYYRDYEFPKAIVHLKKWVDGKPQDSESLKFLADCQLKSGDKEGAIESYERLTRLLPKNFEFLVKSAVLLEMGLDQKERALAVYSQLKNFFGSKGSQGKLEFNLEAKIAELEKVVGKTKEKSKSPQSIDRAPASVGKQGGQI